MATIKASPIMKGPKPTNGHPQKMAPIEGGVTVPGIGSTTKKAAIPGVAEGTTLPKAGAAPKANTITRLQKPPKVASVKISAKTSKPAKMPTKSAFTPRKPSPLY